MLTERSKVPLELKKRDFFPAKNPVDESREVVEYVDRKKGTIFVFNYLSLCEL